MTVKMHGSPIFDYKNLYATQAEHRIQMLHMISVLSNKCVNEIHQLKGRFVLIIFWCHFLVWVARDPPYRDWFKLHVNFKLIKTNFIIPRWEGHHAQFRMIVLHLQFCSNRMLISNLMMLKNKLWHLYLKKKFALWLKLRGNCRSGNRFDRF